MARSRGAGGSCSVATTTFPVALSEPGFGMPRVTCCPMGAWGYGAGSASSGLCPLQHGSARQQ